MLQFQKEKTGEGCDKSFPLIKQLLFFHGRAIHCSLLRRLFPPCSCLSLYQLFVVLRHLLYRELTQSSDLQCSWGLDLPDRNTHIKFNPPRKTDTVQITRPKIWPCGGFMMGRGKSNVFILILPCSKKKRKNNIFTHLYLLFINTIIHFTTHSNKNQLFKLNPST